MSATNTKPGAPDPNLYAPFESKESLMTCIRDSLVGVDQSRLQDLLLRLGATDSCLWPDPHHIAS